MAYSALCEDRMKQYVWPPDKSTPFHVGYPGLCSESESESKYVVSNGVHLAKPFTPMICVELQRSEAGKVSTHDGKWKYRL